MCVSVLLFCVALCVVAGDGVDVVVVVVLAFVVLLMVPFYVAATCD